MCGTDFSCFLFYRRGGLWGARKVGPVVLRWATALSNGIVADGDRDSRDIFTTSCTCGSG